METYKYPSSEGTELGISIRRSLSAGFLGRSPWRSSCPPPSSSPSRWIVRRISRARSGQDNSMIEIKNLD